MMVDGQLKVRMARPLSYRNLLFKGVSKEGYKHDGKATTVFFLKAGFHMIANRNKVCDRLRS